jgi:hypothetical protein
MTSLPPSLVMADSLPNHKSTCITCVRFRTVNQYYSNITRDPFSGNYGRIMLRFATIQERKQQIQMSKDNPDARQAYLCCAPSRQGPRIYRVHMPSKFASVLDGTAIQWDH